MKYYAMGQFSRYIRPNDTIIQAGEHVIASWNQEERKLVLVMVNDTNEKQSCKVDLDEFVLKGAKICPIRTSGSIENGEHWNRLESSVLTENIFETELKENSITTFVIR